MVDVVVTDFSRVFLLPGRAGPRSVPQYEGYWKAGALSWKQGDPKSIRIPSPTQYKEFTIVGKMFGDQGDPQITLRARYTTDLSQLLAIVRNGCDQDLQVHIGQCGNPQDFNGGWEKILVLEGGSPSNYAINDLGALAPSERALVEEEVPFIGETLYEIKRIVMSEGGKAVTNQEVIDIHVCDVVQCGACGFTSDGCQIVFAIMLSQGGSPGLGAELLYTQDGGAVWNRMSIASLPANHDPNRISCVGPNVVVVSADDGAMHYAPSVQVLAGTDAWVRIATGFNVSGGPRAIFSTDPVHTWIVGAAGYIYFTNDPTTGVNVQDSGVASTQQYNDISGSDIDNLAAVGNQNAMVFTNNGGLTWAPITGPAPGVNLKCVAVLDANTFWVGDAAGNLWVTSDAGQTWTNQPFPGYGSGSVNAIKFVNNTVGYLGITTAGGAGRIMRTISGGQSWYVAPEGNAMMPANAGIDALAVCVDPNVVFGAGLATGRGFLVKGE